MSKKTIIATLVRGETYVLRDQTFKRGWPQPVTAEVRAYLQKHALEQVTRIGVGPDGENETRVLQKFEFKTTGEAEADNDRAA